MKTDNFRLINEVSKRQALWDTNISLSTRKDSWTSQWQEVSAIMQLDVATCKKRFKSLRDSYRSEIRKLQIKRSGSSSWCYFRSLEFLRHIFDPDGHVPFAPEDYDAANACTVDDSNNLEDFIIDLDNDESYDFEIMDDIFKRDSSSVGQDAESDKSLKKRLEINTSEAETSPTLLSPMQLPPNHSLIPRPPPAKRGRPCRTSSSYEGSIAAPECSNGTIAPHKDDSDYSYLISLLPHMKSLSDIGNLKFRMETSRILVSLKQEEKSDSRDLGIPILPKLTPAPVTGPSDSSSVYAISESYVDSSMIECDVKIENEPLI